MRKVRKPELEPTKVPTLLDIAWATGIYEGEGTCRRCVRGGVEVAVTQKDPEILFRLRDWFGGSVKDNGANTGCSYWNACGDRARVFLALCYPTLSARRRMQVDTSGGIEFLRGVSPVGKSVEQLKDHLLDCYQYHREQSRQRNNETKKAKYHAEKKTLSPKIVAIA